MFHDMVDELEDRIIAAARAEVLKQIYNSNPGDRGHPRRLDCAGSVGRRTRNRLLRSDVVIKGGITGLMKPGLGIEVYWDLIAPEKVAALS